MKRTRLIFGIVAFVGILIVATLKHWYPGISTELVISACVPVLGYILGETYRASKNKE